MQAPLTLAARVLLSVSSFLQILLIVAITLVCCFLFMALWPHLARLKAGAARQGALLSHVPPELDVRAHVRSVFRRAVAANAHGHAAAKKKAPAALTTDVLRTGMA